MNISLIGNEAEKTEAPFLKFKNWVDFYSKKSGIRFEIDENLPAPAAVPDNSIDDNLTIIVNPRLLIQENKFNEEELIFVFFHEIEHLIEDGKLKSTQEGKNTARERQARFQKAKHLSKAMHTLENIIRDVYVNNQISQKAPALQSARTSSYREHLFKEHDFLNMPVMDQDGNPTGEKKAFPKHLQFAYTILREAMLPDETCIIDPEIRKKIERLQRAGIIEKSSSGDLEDRLESIWKYLEPIYKQLLQEDIEEQSSDTQDGENKDSQNTGDQSEQQEENSSNGDTGQEESEDQENEGNTSDGQENSEDVQPGSEESEEKDSQQENNEAPDTESSSSSQESQNTSDESEKQTGEESGGDREDDEIQNHENEEPKNPFDELYDDVGELPHILEESLKEEDMQKIQEKIDQKTKKFTPKSKEQLELEKRAENMGIDPSDEKQIEQVTKRLQEYDRFLETLQSLKDPETGNSVMEEICSLFQQIRANRLKPKMKSKGPVDMEHGIRLDTGSIATGIAQIKSGETNPIMFQEDTTHERENLLVGDFDVSIVADGSGSMNGEKNRQQKIATLLIFEALKLLHDTLEMDVYNLIQAINFSTEGIMFTGNSTKEFKKSSRDFTDSERLETYSLLDYCSGASTNDYEALSDVIEELKNKPDEYLQSIQQGKTKRIVIVLSDGGSGNSSLMQENINILREYGVLVYGIGITDEGSPIIDLFAGEDVSLGFGQVCDKPEHLAKTLKDLLISHIREV